MPVINSVYTSAFYKHLWFFVKNVDLMEVYTQKCLDEFGHPSPAGAYSDPDEHGQSALGLTVKRKCSFRRCCPECRALPDFFIAL